MRRILLLVALLITTTAHAQHFVSLLTDGSVTPNVQYNWYRNNSKIAGPFASLGLVDTSVSAGTSYTYTVRAVNTSGIESADSGSVIANVPADPTPPPQSGGPSGYTPCAGETENCPFTGTRNVGYGANNVFVFRDLTGGTPCTNAVFTDPLPGVTKACYLKNVVVVPPPPPPPPVLNTRFAYADTFKVVTGGSRLAVRSAASSTSSILRNLNNGTTGTIAGGFINGFWPVLPSGWVSDLYIRQ